MRVWMLAGFVFSTALAGHLVAQVPPAKTNPPSTPPATTATPKPADGSEEFDVAAQMIKDGRLDDAFKKIEEAVKKNPTLGPARLVFARMIYQLAPAQARPFLEAAAADSPDHPDVFLTLADIAQHEGRYAEAILNATKALDLVNSSQLAPPQKLNTQKGARSILAGAYERRRDWKNAKAQFEAWLELDQKNGFVRERYATVLFSLDKSDDALKEYQRAAKDDPSLFPPDIQMARQFAARGDDARATQYFENAVRANPNNILNKIAYADYLLQKAKIEQAKVHIEAAKALEPQNQMVKQMQGLLARLTKDYSAAERIFQEMYSASPANVNASNQLALVLAESGDAASRKRGLEIAESNARQFGQSPDLLATLAYSYYRNGNNKDAKTLLLGRILQAVRVPPPETAYYMALTLADDPSSIDDAKDFLKAALETKGLFFYRNEAQALYDRLEKTKPTSKPKGG